MILFSPKIFSDDMFFRHSPVATIVVNEKLNILAINPAGQTLLGYSEEALIQKSLAVLMPPTLRDEHIQRTKDRNPQEPSRIIGQNRPVSVMKADGSYTTVILSVNELNIGDNIYYIGTLADSTVITSKTAEIEKANHLLDQILNSTKDFIFIFGVKGACLEVFTQSRERLLLPYSDMIGKHYRDILSGPLADLYEKAMTEAQTTRQEQSFEFEFTFNDGKKVYFLSTMAFFEIPGEISGFMNIVKDIGELKEKEQALLTAQEEKSNLISVVSHEMRNAINKILGFASLGLTQTSSLIELTSYLTYIESSAQDLKKLASQILDHHKLEKHQLEVTPENIFNIQRRLGQLINEYGPLITQKNIKLEKKYLNTLSLDLRFDFNHLATILNNLLSNAIKFTPDNGRIEISFDQEALNEKQIKLIIRIKDSGIGISPQNIKKLFKPFSQIKSSRSHEGSGLGLAISQNLAQLLGGEITVQSEEDQGSQFTVSIVADLLDSSGQITQKSNVENTVPHIGKLFKHKALIIEDDALSIALIKLWLKLADFNEIHIVENASKMNLMIESQEVTQYPLVIVDKNFFNANGLETIKRLRNLVNPKETTIVFSSGDYETDQLMTAMENGANLIFPKPVNFIELFKALEKLKLY